MTKVQRAKETKGWVYCPICTHTVESNIVILGKTARVKSGEKCPRCRAALEAASVQRLQAAA